jgi:hypothetical protein
MNLAAFIGDNYRRQLKMDDKELIINTAKEILITALEYEDIISPEGEVSPDEVVDEIGEAFKTLTQKVSEALKSIKE